LRRLSVSLGFDFFPKECTCDGEGCSPEVRVQGAPEGAVLAILMEDVDAPQGPLAHWLAWNVKPRGGLVPKCVPKKLVVSEPVEAYQGKNDFGEIGYTGPCPPPGEVRRYRVTVFLLERELDLVAGSSKVHFLREVPRRAVAWGEAYASYRR